MNQSPTGDDRKVDQYVEAARACFPHVLSHKCWVQKARKLSLRRRPARSEVERTEKIKHLSIWLLESGAP